MVTVIKGIAKAAEERIKQILEDGGEVQIIDSKSLLETSNILYEYTFSADLEVENEIQVLSFNVSLKELEEDYNITDILTLKLENYIQNKYCHCSFSETQNHCDCELGDYHVVEIFDRKLLTAVLDFENPIVNAKDFNNQMLSLGASQTNIQPTVSKTNNSLGE